MDARPTNSSGETGPDKQLDIEIAHDEHGHERKISDDVVYVKNDEVAKETAFVGLTKVQAIKKFWRAAIYCYMCAFGVMMDGYQNSLPGAIIANQGFVAQFATIENAAGEMVLNPAHVSAWSGVSFVGQVTGTLLGGLVADRFGRRIAQALMTLFLALASGVVVEMVSRSWQVWLVGKIITGLGQGVCQCVMVTYISEIAPAQIRGSLLSAYAWGYAIGQLFSAIALQVVNITNPDEWLRGIYSEWVPLGLWMIMWLFMPETPWYYARKEQADKAKKTLSRIYKGVPDYDVDREYNAMVLEIAHERENRAISAQTAWKDLLMGTNLKRTFASVFGLACQKWSGSSVVFNYTTFFFQQAGIPEPFQANVIVFCTLIFALMISFYAIERVGRRRLILVGGCFAFTFNLIIGSLGQAEQTESVQSAALAVICMWVFNYAICFAGTGWTLAGEVATPRLRAKTASFTAFSNAVAGAIYDTTVPLMLANSGPGSQGWGLSTLYMFAILIGVGTCINYFMIPETKGRTFNEMDELYESGIPPRKMRKHVTRIEQTGMKEH